MRLFAHLVAALAVLPGTLAVDQKKSAIIWFDDPATPDSVINQAKESIIKAGGKITHVYTIIKFVYRAAAFEIHLADRQLGVSLSLHLRRHWSPCRQ